MKSAPVLWTDRLTLREIREEDTPFIVKIRSDPEVYPFFLHPHKLTEEEHLSWFRNQYIYDGNRIDWIGFDEADTPIGVFGIKRSGEHAAEAEISYIVDPAQYGKGFGKEAVERIIRFVKEDWNVKAVMAQIHKSNKKSVLFAGKLGMLETGRHGDFIVFQRLL